MCVNASVLCKASVCTKVSVCQSVCVKASMCVLKASVGVWVCVCVFCTHTPFLQNSKRSMPVSRRLVRRFLWTSWPPTVCYTGASARYNVVPVQQIKNELITAAQQLWKIASAAWCQNSRVSGSTCKWHWLDMAGHRLGQQKLSRSLQLPGWGAKGRNAAYLGSQPHGKLHWCLERWLSWWSQLLWGICQHEQVSGYDPRKKCTTLDCIVKLNN